MASSIPTRGPELLAVDILFMILAIVANALRCYVRIRMVKAFGLDDWLMSLATVGVPIRPLSIATDHGQLFFIAYSTSSIIGVKYGTGKHHHDLSIENVYAARHCWWYCYLFYCCSTILSKISIGCFLLRIAVRKLHTYIIYAAMFVSIVAGGTFFFVTLFQCNPVTFFWNKAQDGTCINDDIIIGLGFLYSGFAIITDFTFALLPAFLIAGLQLRRRTKIALIPLLAMGCMYVWNSAPRDQTDECCSASLAVVARLPFVPRLKSKDFLCKSQYMLTPQHVIDSFQGILSTSPSGPLSSRALPSLLALLQLSDPSSPSSSADSASLPSRPTNDPPRPAAGSSAAAAAGPAATNSTCTISQWSRKKAMSNPASTSPNIKSRLIGTRPKSTRCAGCHLCQKRKQGLMMRARRV